MIKENDNEKLSRLFDGDLGGDIPGDINRENWKIYSIIGDSLRDGPQYLSRDISAEVRSSIEEIAANESKRKDFGQGYSAANLLAIYEVFVSFPKREAISLPVLL